MPPQAIKISVEHMDPDLVRITMGPKTLDLSAQSALELGAAIQGHAQALLNVTAQNRMADMVAQSAPVVSATGDNRTKAAGLIVELLNMVNQGAADATPITPNPANQTTIDSGPARLSAPEAGREQPAPAGLGLAGG